MITKDSPK